MQCVVSLTALLHAHRRIHVFIYGIHVMRTNFREDFSPPYLLATTLSVVRFWSCWSSQSDDNPATTTTNQTKPHLIKNQIPTIILQLYLFYTTVVRRTQQPSRTRTVHNSTTLGGVEVTLRLGGSHSSTYPYRTVLAHPRWMDTALQ